MPTFLSELRKWRENQEYKTTPALNLKEICLQYFLSSIVTWQHVIGGDVKWERWPSKKIRYLMKSTLKSGQIPVHQRNGLLCRWVTLKQHFRWVDLYILGMQEVFLINYHRNSIRRIVIIPFGQSRHLKHTEFGELPSVFEGVAELRAEPKSSASALPDWWWWWLNYWHFLLHTLC